MSVEVTKIVKHYGDDNELHRKGGSALQEYVNDILSKEEWYTHGRLCKRKIYNGEGKLRHMSIHFKERRNDTGLDAQGYMVYTYYKSKSFK